MCSPLSAVNKPTMMQDTPTTYPDCAALYKSGNTDSGVYSLALPNTTQEIKVQLNSYVNIHLSYATYKLPTFRINVKLQLRSEVYIHLSQIHLNSVSQFLTFNPSKNSLSYVS